MATLTITIPDTRAARIRDAFADAYGYQSQVPNPSFDSTQPEDPTTNPRLIANSESKGAFMKKQVIRYIVEVVKGQEAQAAESAARKTAIDAVDADITLT